jgi:hypothetical protein
MIFWLGNLLTVGEQRTAFDIEVLSEDAGSVRLAETIPALYPLNHILTSDQERGVITA